MKVLLVGLFLIWTGIQGARAAGQGSVATAHTQATQAGLNALRQGGNAIDAAIAAGLTLGVVDGANSGLGGGSFILIRLASGEFIGIDGRETAPQAAHRNLFIRNGKAVPELSRSGPLSVAVPGALAAYALASQNFGRIPMARLLVQSAELAERGFPIDAQYAQRLQSLSQELSRQPAARQIFFSTNGSPLPAGSLLRQTDLGASYRALAASGTDWFYGGPFALNTERWMRQNGGLLTAADFKNYPLRLRLPIRTTYRGFEIVGFPPPSSGGVHVAQILNILEQYDLRRMGINSPDFIHVVTEAMKLAFADRAYFLGDPDFVTVPPSLVGKPYGVNLAKSIRLDRALKVPQHGNPTNPAAAPLSQHTTHISTADNEGNWVACTATLNTSFGSKIVLPGTGILLNNEMDDFAAQPGVPNAFGLVGGEANAVAPGKRPLSSMSPTVVLQNGQPILSVGAAGGPTIISQTVLAIIYSIDFGLSLDQVQAQLRFHHQWKPDELRIEKKVKPEVVTELKKRGHNVVLVESLGATQMVGRSGRELIGAADPRVGSSQAGTLR